MSTARRHLPQLCGGLFLTDGALRRPSYSTKAWSCPTLPRSTPFRDRTGRAARMRYYERHIAIAKAARLGFILEGPHLACQQRLRREARLYAPRDRRRQP
jgi:homocysteine S-methyltransferase